MMRFARCDDRQVMHATERLNVGILCKYFVIVVSLTRRARLRRVVGSGTDPSFLPFAFSRCTRRANVLVHALLSSRVALARTRSRCLALHGTRTQPRHARECVCRCISDTLRACVCTRKQEAKRAIMKTKNTGSGASDAVSQASEQYREHVSRGKQSDYAHGGKSPRKGGVVKKRRDKALDEIRKYQRSIEDVIPYRPFERLVKEIIKDSRPSIKLRIQKEAVLALQSATEAFLVQVFQELNLNAIHAGRSTLKLADVLHQINSDKITDGALACIEMKAVSSAVDSTHTEVE